MHRDKIPPQRMHAACRIVTRRSCCTKHLAEFNDNCESYCSLKQLVALLCAAHEGKSASGTYHPKTEGYTRRYSYRPQGLLYCGGVHLDWNNWAAYYSNYLVLFLTNSFRTVDSTGASASCFGERYRGVLSPNLDENNSTQTSTDCCTANNSVTMRVCVCATYSVLGTPAYMLYIVMWNQTLYLLQIMIPLLLCRQQGEEPTKRHTRYGMRNRPIKRL